MKKKKLAKLSSTNDIFVQSLNESTVYIIVNESLNMSKGKIASQSAHGILNIHRFLIKNGIDHSRWINNGEKIVVLKTKSDQINKILSDYSEKIPSSNTLNIFPVYDAGRTEVESGSLTVLVSTPISDDKKPDFLKEMRLL
jgi:peptidyl-tRNA hydrolase